MFCCGADTEVRELFVLVILFPANDRRHMWLLRKHLFLFINMRKVIVSSLGPHTSDVFV